jgi:TRAP-type C4-dicarboxylate transport system permease small subunit
MNLPGSGPASAASTGVGTGVGDGDGASAVGRAVEAVNSALVLGLRCAVGLAYVVIVGAGVVQVLARFVFRVPISWTEETIRFVFIWSVFLMAALLFEDDSHIRVDFFSRYIPPKLRRAFDLVGDTLTVLVLGAIVVLGTQLMQVARETDATSPAMQVPMVWVYAVFPIGGALMLWGHARRVWRRWRRRDHGGTAA